MKNKPSIIPTHTDLFRAMVSDPHRATILIREHLPDEIIDCFADKPPKLLDHTYISKELRETQGDCLFEVVLKAGGRAYVYFLVELNSRFDANKLVEYLISVREQLLRENPRMVNPPTIIPVVLHFGAEEAA